MADLVQTLTAGTPEHRPHTAGTRLVLNSLSNFIGQAVVILLTFVSTPYITRKLGASQYGSLSLLMTYLFAFSLLNLGINTSLVKYLAGLMPKQELGEMQRYLSTSVTLLGGMGCLVSGFIFLMAEFIARHFFKGPAELLPATIVALRISSVAFLLQFLTQATSAVSAAAQRFDLMNLMSATTEALRIVLTIAVLSRGGQLPSMMLVAMFSSLLLCVAYGVVGRRLVPRLTFRPGFSRTHFRALVNHSKYVLIGNVSNHAVGAADSFVIGYYLPVANVAYYSIASTLARRLWGMVGNVATVVFPAASAFSENEQHEHLREVYLRGTKVAAVVAMYPALALSLYSSEFLRFWLSPEYASQGGLVLSLLTIGFLLNSLTHIPYQVLQSTHYVATAARAQLLYAVINLSLFFGMIPRFGIRGAAIGFLLAQVLFVPWFVGRANRAIGLRHWNILLVYGRVLITALISSFAAWILRPWVHSLLKVGIAVIVGLTVYAALACLVVFDHKEKESWRLLVLRWTSRKPAPVAL